MLYCKFHALVTSGVIHLCWSTPNSRMIITQNICTRRQRNVIEYWHFLLSECDLRGHANPAQPLKASRLLKMDFPNLPKYWNLAANRRCVWFTRGYSFISFVIGLRNSFSGVARFKKIRNNDFDWQSLVV